MALLAIDIARLVHHHLLKDGYENTANCFINECAHLKGLKPVKSPYRLPRLLGPSLVDLLESYFETKDFVIEELDLLKTTAFREQDSLPTLTKTLLENLKSQTSLVPEVQKETNDVCVNTELSSGFPGNVDNSHISTIEVAPKETCDASVNTDVPFSYQEKVNSSLAEPEQLSSKESHDIGVNTELFVNSVLDNQNKDNSSNSFECPIPQKDDVIDFAYLYDRLLEDREFQEKIAENINKKKAEVSLPSGENSKSGSLSSSQDLNAVIKAIVAETQADPAFDNFLKDCIGIDSEDPTPVGTPDSTACHDGELIASPVNTYVENSENPVPECMQVAVPPIAPQSLCTIQNSDLLSNASSVNTLNSVAIVTSSGQITLVPTVVTAMPDDHTKPKKKRRNEPIRRAPIPIAPKPVITLTIPQPMFNIDQVSAAVDCAVSEAVSDFVVEFGTGNATDQLEGACQQNQEIQSSPGPSKPTRLVRSKHRLLSKRPRTHKSLRTDIRNIQAAKEKASNPQLDLPPNSSQITPAMAELMKIAQEACKSLNIEDRGTTENSEVAQQSPNVTVNTPALDSSGIITTPTSSRRRSHVRQLNFGESPEFNDKPVTRSPAVLPKRSDIPWDCALRNAIAAPSPSDEQIFATPKGKAKRARKHSPTSQVEKEASGEVASNDAVVADNSTSTCSATSDQNCIVSSTPLEKGSLPSDSSAEQRFCVTTNSSYADLVAASILNEMANTPAKEATYEQDTAPTEERAIQLRIPESNLPNFGMEVIASRGDSASQNLALPDLATPRKEPENLVQNQFTNLNIPCDGQSSNSFNTWEGEVPKTPQIRLDLTSSTSPFQVSLTKGFRFLPAADSPSLAVPATPCIFEVNNSNNSIETPYTGFYQFPSVLNTPRLEALRQELMESPGKSLSITMISPTQVVLGRPTPYFVPSGERSQGPVNLNATPEHIPEPDKMIRRRRSSTEMDPLRLEEESNDASDAAAAFMCEAAEKAVAAIQPLTPYKTDQTLENDLINECQRLEDPPSTERVKLRQQRYVELFGEDSNNINNDDVLTVPEKSKDSELQTTPKTSKQKAKKPKRTVISSTANSGCARATGYLPNRSPSRRKSARCSQNSKSSKACETEILIQEVLELGLAGTIQSKGLSKNQRKRRSESLDAEQSQRIVEQKRLSLPSSANFMSNEHQTTEHDNIAAASPSSSTSSLSSSKEVNVVDISEPITAKNKKTVKETKKRTPKETKRRSPSDLSARKTPVKLFKTSLSQCNRRKTSHSQSSSSKKRASPRLVTNAIKEATKDKENNSEIQTNHMVAVVETPNSIIAEECSSKQNIMSVEKSPEIITSATVEYVRQQLDVVQSEFSLARTTEPAEINQFPSLSTEEPAVRVEEPTNLEKPEDSNGISAANTAALLSGTAQVNTKETDCAINIESNETSNKDSISEQKNSTNSAVSAQSPSAAKSISIPSRQLNCNSEDTLKEFASSLDLTPVTAKEITATNCNDVTQRDKTEEKGLPNSSATKPRRSNSKLHNYVRLSNLSALSPKVSTIPRSSIRESTDQASVFTGDKHQRRTRAQETAVMNNELVNKIKKGLRLSKEFNIYSQ